MLNSSRKFGFVPAGKHLVVENLLRYANATPLFDTILAAKEWLDYKTDIDNKEYIQIVEVLVVINESKGEK